MWQNPSGLLDGSGVSREVHAPFCERLRVKSPRPTLQTDSGSMESGGPKTRKDSQKVACEKHEVRAFTTTALTIIGSATAFAIS